MPPEASAINNSTLQAGQFDNLPPIVQKAEIKKEIKEETIQDLLERIGKNFGTTTTEIALAVNQAENPDDDRCNRELGCRGGIGEMMITKSTFKENCKGDVYDRETNILCGMKMISREEYWRWEASMYDMPKHKGWLGRLATSTREYVEEKMSFCSCVKYVATRVEIPRIKTFFNLNSNTMPVVGAIALLNYNGVAHGGIIRNMTEKGIYIDDANFIRCKETKNRFISWEEWKKVGRGFWRYMSGY